jgi:hypothetical protein
MFEMLPTYKLLMDLLVIEIGANEKKNYDTYEIL